MPMLVLTKNTQIFWNINELFIESKILHVWWWYMCIKFLLPWRMQNYQFLKMCVHEISFDLLLDLWWLFSRLSWYSNLLRNLENQISWVLIPFQLCSRAKRLLCLLFGYPKASPSWPLRQSSKIATALNGVCGWWSMAASNLLFTFMCNLLWFVCRNCSLFTVWTEAHVNLEWDQQHKLQGYMTELMFHAYVHGAQITS